MRKQQLRTTLFLSLLLFGSALLIKLSADIAMLVSNDKQTGHQFPTDLIPHISGNENILNSTNETTHFSALAIDDIFSTVSFIGIILLLLSFLLFIYTEVKDKLSINLAYSAGSFFKRNATSDSIDENVFGNNTSEELLEREKEVMEMIATGRPMFEILRSIALNYESNCKGSICSILLMDKEGKHLKHGAGPSLPKQYIEAIDGAPIGPKAGSCGTAAFAKKRIIVSDIANDPLWTDYKDLALAHGLKACWSTPIIGIDGKVMATFAIYYTECKQPGMHDFGFIDMITNQVKISLEHYQYEIRLRESEEKYRVLVEQASDAIFVNDKTFRYIEANSRACDLLGYTREELRGMTIHDVVVIQHSDRPLRINELKEGKPVLQERELRKKDGSFVSVEVSAVRMSNGNYQGIVRDITKRKKAQAEIEGRERRFRALIENNDGIITVIDKEFNVQYRSPSAARITGWTHAEYEKISARAYIHPEDIEYMQRVMMDSISKPGIPIPFTSRAKHKDGHYLWLEGVVNNLLHDEDIQGIVTNVRDITERKMATEELVKSKQQFQNLIENISGVYWVTNLQTYQTLYISPSYEKIWGRKCTDLYNDPADFIEAIHPEDRKIVLETHRGIGETNNSSRVTYRIIKPSGEVRWISAKTNVVTDAADEAREYGYAEDVTEWKIAMDDNQQLQDLNQQILESMIDGYVLADMQGNLISVNQSYVNMIGYSEEELLKMNINHLAGVPYEEVIHKIEILAQKGPIRFETTHIKKDKKLLDVEVSIAVRQFFGKPVVVAFMRNVSEEKTGRKRLERQYHALEEYAFINSHEVRARVATMLGLMNLYLKDYVAGDERTEIIRHLNNETNDLDRIIRELSILVNKDRD